MKVDVIEMKCWYLANTFALRTTDGTLFLYIPRDETKPAMIYELFVRKNARKSGQGKALLNKAEEICKKYRDEVCLEWDSRDTPEWVYKWYLRQGYDDKAFNENVTLLCKQLK